MKDCRSFVGFLSKEPLSAEERKRMEELGFRVRDIPHTSGRTTVYPFRKYLGPLSFIVAAILVYGSIGKQMGCVANSKKSMTRETMSVSQSISPLFISDRDEPPSDEESGIMELYHEKYIQFFVPDPREARSFADIDYVQHGVKGGR